MPLQGKESEGKQMGRTTEQLIQEALELLHLAQLSQPPLLSICCFFNLFSCVQNEVGATQLNNNCS
jgi:hypothetical protein